MGLYDIDPSLNWDVETRPLYADTSGQIVPGYKRIVHGETGATLNICKDTYTPISNTQLVDLAETLAGNYDFEIEGYASFKFGQKVLAYLKNNTSVKLAGFPSKDYLIIGNSHDGSSAFFAGMSNYLYRCENMFSSTSHKWKINHRSGATQKLEDMVDVYDLYFNEKTQMYEQVDRMADINVGEEQKPAFANHILQIDDPDNMSTRMSNKRQELQNSIARECKEVGNNAFGLFNGVTHYTSHMLNSSSTVYGNPFGHANTLNQRALEYCTQLVEDRPKIHRVGNYF